MVKFKVLLSLMVMILVIGSFKQAGAIDNSIAQIDGLSSKVSKSIRNYYGNHYRNELMYGKRMDHDVVKRDVQTQEEEEQEEANKKNKETSNKIWIFFDNGLKENLVLLDMINNQQKQDPKEINRLTGINIESLERRKRRNGGKIHLDQSDLPINPNYISDVNQCASRHNVEIQLKSESKWINAISVAVPLDLPLPVFKQLFNCFAHLSHVSRIELVNRFIRTPGENDGDSVQLETRAKQFESILEYKANTKQQHRTLKTNELGDSADMIFYNNTYGSVNQINIPAAHSAGLNGTGVTILIMDSGFVKTHDVFKHLTIIDEYDFIDNTNETQAPIPNPQNTHGTATLSTMAGYEPTIMVGPAYAAHFLLAKTEDTSREYQQEEDNWIRAMEWGEARGAELVSSSLGYTQWYKYYDLNGEKAPITIAADAAVKKGITVVVSAGNSGNDGIGAPADGKNVIAVAAVSINGDITTFSSRGPSADGRIKPDVAAMGLNNFVADADNIHGYRKMSGTSFSCPLVAGSVALVLQAHPDWSPYQVYTALTKTASHPSQPDTMTGFGIINIFNAINYNIEDDQLAYTPSLNCSNSGCSGHGGCCGNETICSCASDRYGPFCQYQRVECSITCVSRGGKCLLDQYGLQYVCGDPNGPASILYNQSLACTECDGGMFDVCGVCGGSGKSCLGCDGVAFSGKVIDSCGTCGGNGDCKRVVPINEEQKRDNLVSIVVGTVAASVGLALILASVIYLYKRRRQLTSGSTHIDQSNDNPFFPMRGYIPLTNPNEDNNNSNKFSIGNEDDY